MDVLRSQWKFYMINLPFVSLVERIPCPVTTEIRGTKIISIFYVAKNEIIKSVCIIQKIIRLYFQQLLIIYSLDIYLNVQVCVILQLYDCY